MGNTIVFKPSDKTPACGEALAELFHDALTQAGAPQGTFNLVQGATPSAAKLSAHEDLDGILFTGSWPVGRRILEANLDHPGRIVALELGGNNPAVVMPDADLRQAAIEIVRCAFNTTGQRCTCTRRAIIHEAVADKLIPAIIKAASALVVGDPRSDTPVFMGPLVSADARTAAFAFEKRLADAGGEVLLESTGVPSLESTGGHYVTPSIVRVPRFTAAAGDASSGFDAGCDEELFGPLLRITTVKSLDEAIKQANATRYGLAASIFTKDTAAADRFRREARAGCVNVNCGTAGASSKLPFGGLGLSGNHRPAGSFALDYCAYPTAGMTELADAAAIPAGMTFDDAWL
jgi:succinylglutamic semialdehyde dehydrogenase